MSHVSWSLGLALLSVLNTCMSDQNLCRCAFCILMEIPGCLFVDMQRCLSGLLVAYADLSINFVLFVNTQLVKVKSG